MRLFQGLLLFISGLGLTLATARPYYSQKEIPSLLDWTKTDNPANLCKGFFAEPQIIIENPIPGKSDASPTIIRSKGPVHLIADGRSLLQDEVVLTQPGRLLKADKAYIVRDKESSKIKAIELIGNVRYQEHNRLLVAPKAYLDLTTNTLTMPHALYHFRHKGMDQKTVDSWGQGDQVKRDGNDVITIQNSTYSNASPVKPAWKLHATQLRLDRQSGWGTAKHAWLIFKHIPIMYVPYFTFPIDHRRKSGFLVPSLSLNNNNGADLKVPYYWNMAPNYDMTITPRVMTKRGIQINDQFRYLTKKHSGSAGFSFLPADQKFKQFKNDIFKLYPPKEKFDPYLDKIKNESDNRGHFLISDATKWDKRWSSHLLINRVTDDYYFQDFGSVLENDVTTNQLLNEINLHYEGLHWQFTTLAQGYQTLHPIAQAENPAEDQYQRLPEFDLHGEYPDIFDSVNFQVGTDATNFDWHSRFMEQKPTGQRIHARPSFNRPFTGISSYLTPEVMLDVVGYQTQHLQPGMKESSDRALPLFDLDSGLYFYRQLILGSRQFIQTLEPRAFYLFVPYKNQNNLPNFDTQLLPFTFGQLFSTNQFTGIDRIQNANQLSLGLTTRILDPNSGYQKLTANGGFITYFEKPKVCLNNACTVDQRLISPFVGGINYFPTELWSVSGNGAWDPKGNHVDNAGTSLVYNKDSQQVFDTGYQFIHANDNDENSKQYQTAHVGMAWPIAYQWSTLVYAEYNLTQHHTQAIYGGLEYYTCGWSLRFLASRAFLGNNENLRNLYQNVYSIQLALTGLGTVGSANPAGLLANTLPSYRNAF